MEPPHESFEALGPPSVTVEFGPVELELSDPVIDMRWDDGTVVTADARSARMEILGVRYAVDEGRRVTVEAPSERLRALVDGQLRSTVTAFLLAQRHMFALHGNAVAGRSGAIIVAGDRGAGKSSTSASLDQRGLTLLADDICPVSFDVGRPLLTPTGRPLRLDPEAALALGLDPGDAPQEAPGSNKLIMRTPVAAPTRVGSIVVLTTDPDARAVTLEALGGVAGLAAVEGQLYRGELLHPIYRAATFKWASALATAVPVVRLVRPEAGWTMDAVVDAIEGLQG